MDGAQGETDLRIEGRRPASFGSVSMRAAQATQDLDEEQVEDAGDHPRTDP